MMPLDYLLGIMRDENRDARWRLDAATWARTLAWRRPGGAGGFFIRLASDSPAKPSSSIARVEGSGTAHTRHGYRRQCSRLS
jgi:hypothetical protein